VEQAFGTAVQSSGNAGDMERAGGGGGGV
jgi:hypothetical protein